MTTSLFHVNYITEYKFQNSWALHKHNIQNIFNCACCEICTEQYNKSKNSNNFLTDNRTPSLKDGQFPTKYFVQTDTDLVIPQTFNMASDAHLPMKHTTS